MKTLSTILFALVCVQFGFISGYNMKTGGLYMFKPIYQALNNNLHYPMPAFLQSDSPYPYNAHSALGYGAIKPFGIQSLFGGAYPGYLAPPLYQPYDPHQQVVTKSVIYSSLLNEILRRLT